MLSHLAGFIPTTTKKIMLLIKHLVKFDKLKKQKEVFSALLDT